MIIKLPMFWQPYYQKGRFLRLKFARNQPGPPYLSLLPVTRSSLAANCRAGPNSCMNTWSDLKLNLLIGS